MAPMELMKQLFKHDDVYVLCLGDPFQLPPVDKNADNHLLDEPHIFLDEIMRQAAESEIIQLTMRIREGKSIDLYQGSEVQVLSKDDLNTGMLQWADQILVATNKTRIDINNQMRDLLGHQGNPQDGDKVICLRNYWEKYSLSGDPLVNGTIGFLNNSYETFSYVPRFLNCSTERIDYIYSDFITDNNERYTGLQMDRKEIIEGERTLNNRDNYTIGKNWKFKHLLPYEFTYGYAITGHKSQRQ
jgi:exodeoxyribonuclease-5